MELCSKNYIFRLFKFCYADNHLLYRSWTFIGSYKPCFLDFAMMLPPPNKLKGVYIYRNAFAFHS